MGELVATQDWEDTIKVPTKSLIDSYKKFDKTAERHRPVVEAVVVPEVKQIFPSALSDRWGKRGERIRGIVFPSLKQARLEFSNHIRFRVEWEETSADDEPQGP